MVWCIATIVGLTITGRLSSAKLKYLETVGECREYSPLAIKTLFISGLESEARELYERTIMYNDAGPTVFCPVPGGRSRPSPRSPRQGPAESALPFQLKYGGQGESLAPPQRRGSVSLCFMARHFSRRHSTQGTANESEVQKPFCESAIGSVGARKIYRADPEVSYSVRTL